MLIHTSKYKCIKVHLWLTIHCWQKIQKSAFLHLPSSFYFVSVYKINKNLNFIFLLYSYWHSAHNSIWSKYYFNIYLSNDTPTMIKIMTQTLPPAAAPIIDAVFVSNFSVFVFTFSSFSNKYEHNKIYIYF